MFGCLAACETDTSENLVSQIGASAAELRASPSTTLTFKYLPKGCRGDFSIMVGANKMLTKPTGVGLVVDCAGGGGGGTTGHLQFVEVPTSLPWRKYKTGDSISVTLIKASDGTIQLVDLQ